jgi:hypothetical protein
MMNGTEKIKNKKTPSPCTKGGRGNGWFSYIVAGQIGHGQGIYYLALAQKV